MDKQSLFIFLVVVASLLGASLLLLSSISSMACRLIVSAVAGLLTYLTLGAATSLAPHSLVSSLYFRLFGLAPVIAHAFDRDYAEEEGLVVKMPWVGVWIDWFVVIVFWSLLFGALYFVLIRRSRRTM